MSSDFIPDFENLPGYTGGKYDRDYHAKVSVQLCELIDGNWLEWYTVSGSGDCIPNSSWAWDYYDIEQYKRVCDKFNARYWFDEISLMPPLVWKEQLIRKFNELMPKYKPLYKMLDSGYDPMQVSGKYGKSRLIYSEFPETLLNGNSDYVSNGSDREYEDIETGDWIDKALKLAREYSDVDVLLLDELECMFTQLYSVSLNGM